MPSRNTDRARQPVMRDVARLAGVSHQSVSRVINDNPQVSPDVRARVQAAMKQLGYKPNTVARALARRRTMNIGVIAAGTFQYGPTVMLLSIAETARQAGYATRLLNPVNADRAGMQTAIDQLVDDSVDGIVVLAPVTAAATAVEGLTTDVPLVMFEPDLDNGTTMVAIDESLGARLATRHLLELGHRTVRHVSGPPGWLGTEARIRGWRDELASWGRVAHPTYEGDWSAASGHAAGARIAADPDVTAVYVANDQMALGVLQALGEAGRDVPGDISVVGFDDTPEAAYYRPALTTVRLDFAAVGRRCVERLVELIQSRPLQPQPRVPPELVVRASSAPPRH
ncbi:LacI family DNA-binding transcriptional regulator [Pseudonocardia kunmingensis]|uniref:LacI family transcriptional regulator n=1 Tax=Pseudonocardia kunmingensis TaxID=630975 RepID=A0A543DVG4_9PSEU|nr:LacI family DNA-binding transcriptional regulator [Pseudonocardia kunmingensis]TQM13315.1 LacI family transcriptional regulator [Pseudonocardia kunmingensis]